MRRFHFALLLAFSAPLLFGTPMTYELSGVGWGTVAGVPFSGASFSFSLSADTANLTNVFNAVVMPVTGSVTVGGASGTILSQIALFGAWQEIGLFPWDGSQGGANFFWMNSTQLPGSCSPVCNTDYDLTTPLTVVSDSVFSQTVSMQTDMGSLMFTGIINPITFTAADQIASPEPATVLFVPFGLCVLLFSRYMRRSTTAPQAESH
jgi:hypothetical protein